MFASHAHTQSWPVAVGMASAFLVVALVYLRGWLCLRSAFPKLIPGWRLAAFIGGLLSVWATTASPLAAFDHQSLTVHMMKHLLLMTVAAPLILAGAPVFPLVSGFPKLFIQGDSVLVSWSARWVERAPIHLVSCWLAGTAAVLAWHIPIAFQLGMRSRWAHTLEDACFLLTGLLFWCPIVPSSPSATKSPGWSAALYLFLATLPCDILSAFLVFCNRLVYPYYRSTTQLFSLTPIEDQECAGALMWVWITFAYLIPAVVLTVQILSPANRSSQESTQAATNRPVGRLLDGSEAEVL